MDRLIEEGEKELDCVEDAPDDENSDAKGGEDAVAPEGWRDYCFSSEAFLTVCVEDECRDEDHCDGEQGDRSWSEEVGDTTGQNRQDVGEHAERGAK